VIDDCIAALSKKNFSRYNYLNNSTKSFQLSCHWQHLNIRVVVSEHYFNPFKIIFGILSREAKRIVFIKD